MSILLEICIDSLDSAFAAKEGGADRLEVCSSLAVEGTTPSYGLVKQCVDEVQLPVMMMIRPHDGGFVYREFDISAMLHDIEIAHSIGVQGVVFGALTESRQIHLEHCQCLLNAAGSLETTFHRAFDIVADPIAAFDEIIAMGFDRLLTSGQATTAEEGIPLIRQLCTRAEGRVIVLPGAGVSSSNAQRIVTATGVRELHTMAAATINGQVGEQVAFGTNRKVTVSAMVRAIKDSLCQEPALFAKASSAD